MIILGHLYKGMIILSLLLLTNISVTAQNLELGAGLGFTTYQGELSDGTVAHYIAQVEPIVFFSGGFQLNRYLIFQGEIYSGKLSGDDSSSKNEGRNKRNLSFRSNLYGFNLRMEVNLLPFDYYTDKLLVPYAFGAAGYLHFNPYTFYNGDKIYLRDLGTEGQGLEGYDETYSLWTPVLAGGGGLKMRLSENLFISGEAAYVKSFTDYLDDVGAKMNAPYDVILENRGEIAADLSNKRDNYLGINPGDFQGSNLRGTPGSDDGYFYLRLKATYMFESFSIGRKTVRCPTF